MARSSGFTAATRCSSAFGCWARCWRPSSRSASRLMTMGSWKSRRPSMSNTTIFFRQRQVFAHLQRLVELLIVFHEQHGGARVFAQVLHLFGRVGRVDAIRHAVGAEHGHVGTAPIRHWCWRGWTQFRRASKPSAIRPCPISRTAWPPGPGPAAPDAELLLPHPDVGAALGTAFQNIAGMVSPGMTTMSVPAGGCVRRDPRG